MGFADQFMSIETLTPDYLKKFYLTGLTFVDESGEPYPDDYYEEKIDSAVTQFEMDSQLALRQRFVADEPHDYQASDYQNFCFLQLFNYPVVKGDNFPITVKGVYPTKQAIVTFPNEWVQLNPEHGQIQLVPTAGTLSQVLIGQGGAYLPMLYTSMDRLPNLFHISYTAGFEKAKVPSIIVKVIAKLATMEILSIMGDTVYAPGVTNQSLGIDGVSQGRGFMNNGQDAPIFSGRINQIKREIYGDQRLGYPGMLKQIRDLYRGATPMVVC